MKNYLWKTTKTLKRYSISLEKSSITMMKTEWMYGGNEVLPWNVKINVQPQTVSEEQLTAIRETLGEEADMMLLCDIHFTDMLDGNEYEPDALVTVRIPVPDSYEEGDTLIVIHIKDDGTFRIYRM